MTVPDHKDDVEIAGRVQALRSTASTAENELFLAVKGGHAKSAQYWLDQGADPNAQDDEGMTALHHAAALGARACIRVLIAWGQCDYLIRDAAGRYASDLASEWARDYAVARLLRKKQRHQADERGVPAWEPRAAGV